MSAIALQRLVCDACSGPLDWDGKASVIQCPQCAAPHAIRWNEAAPVRPAAPPPPRPESPKRTPQQRLQALDVAWRRMDDGYHYQGLVVAGIAAVLVAMVGIVVFAAFAGWHSTYRYELMTACGITAMVVAAAVRLRGKWSEERKAVRARSLERYLDQRKKLLAEIDSAHS